MADTIPTTSRPERRRLALEAYLLGLVDYQRVWRLQQRLVYEASGRRPSPNVLLICEHPAHISMGRMASRLHVHCSAKELERQRVALEWVSRGGGGVFHLPGQLAIYPIVSLEDRGWTVGQYLSTLQQALVDTLTELHLAVSTRPGRHGVWGRSGLLASLGVSVSQGMAYHGAFLNVSPPLHQLRQVTADPWDLTPAGTLVAERQQPVRMTSVREGLVRQLTIALDCDRCHLYAGHPLLSAGRDSRREPSARVG